MYCRRCRYPLASLDTSRCPECGRAFDPTDRRSFRKRPHRVPRWMKRSMLLGAVGAVLLGVYFGTYAATVKATIAPMPKPPASRNLATLSGMGDPDPQPAPPQPSIAAWGFQPSNGQLVASYEHGGVYAEWFFGPANWVDRTVRPKRWEAVWILRC